MSFRWIFQLQFILLNYLNNYKLYYKENRSCVHTTRRNKWWITSFYFQCIFNGTKYMMLILFNYIVTAVWLRQNSMIIIFWHYRCTTVLSVKYWIKKNEYMRPPPPCPINKFDGYYSNRNAKNLNLRIKNILQIPSAR